MSHYLFGEDELAPAPPAGKARKPPAKLADCEPGDRVFLELEDGSSELVIVCWKWPDGDAGVSRIAEGGREETPRTMPGRLRVVLAPTP